MSRAGEGKTFEGTLSPAERAKSLFLYLPFEVPSGMSRLDVSYSFDEGDSILDLGLFDPTLGPFPSRSGFRGWSGSARREVFVARDEATPGYLPGEIVAGTWQVVLGLARVLEGCRYRVEVGWDDAPRSLVAPARRVGVARANPGLYCGDLQSHTFYSDAKGSLEDLVAVAKDRGLDFLAVTDHNTNSHHRELAELSSADLLLIPGEELTTYRGHANVWGVDGWVDFRVEQEADLAVLIDQVHARGGLLSINHPKAIPNCLGCDWEYEVPAGADSLEAWQGSWAYQNWESLARYDALLRQGRRLALVGGSDRHQPGYPDTDPTFLQVGSPTTWLWLDDLSVTSVLQAIKTGRGFVSESPGGPRLELRVGGKGMGDTLERLSGKTVTARARVEGARGDLLRWVGSEGVLRETVIAADVFLDEWCWSVVGRYVRLEVIAKASLPFFEAELARLERDTKGPHRLSIFEQPWRRALSNPIYLS